LRRLALIAVAVGLLVAAGAAYAASQINTYTATLKFAPKSAGKAATPVPVSYTQDIKAQGTNGNRTAVLLDIKTKIYGLKADGKDFPTCSLQTIATNHSDASCPAGAKVASGYITAAVGSSKNFQTAGAACDPLLDVWNGGQGKLTFFFVDTPAHQCLGGALKTGSTPPYPATYKTQGKYLVVDVPVPSAISFPVPGEAGSLMTEHLVWAKKTAKVHGKTVAATASIGCLGTKRPYSTTFTANLPSSTGGAGTTQSKTVSGSTAC
jgi:hypothetical protein